MWQATLILYPQKKICTTLSDFDSSYNVILVIFYQL